ncbi:MAG: phage tail protein [Ruminococcus sp.]|nr:phage tail protein [Ruminococcus sp.]
MSKVKFGLSNVHIAPLTIGENSYIYGEIIKVNGAVSISLEPQGDSSDFYADNIKFFSESANQGYEGDLEIAMITDEIREKIFGETKDANGALIESTNDKFKPFALGFQIEGDEKGRRFWYYNCSCSRPKNDAKTTENSKEPSTDSLTIKSMPRDTDGRVRALLPENTTNTEAYKKFFDEVYEAVLEETPTD